MRVTIKDLHGELHTYDLKPKYIYPHNGSKSIDLVMCDHGRPLLIDCRDCQPEEARLFWLENSELVIR